MSPPSRPTGALIRRAPTLWSSCVRTAFWKQLRFMWKLFTLLTVLCVVMQLLGVVRQFRDTRVTGPTAEDLPRSLSQRREREVLYSIPTAAALVRTNSQTFQWKGGNWLTTRERKEKTLRKSLDSTPGRHFISITNRIFGPSGHRFTTKLVPDSRDAAEPEVTKTSTAQHTKSTNANRFLPKVLSTQFPPPPPMPLFGVHRQSEIQAINPLNHDENGKCRPNNHIVFLKTHKTASSTILNMLYRYGDSRNLTFALPTNSFSQLFYPFYFMRYFVEGLRSGRVKEFNIMCNHMRFQGIEVRKVMPVDTFYFSILRNPVYMMESVFSYYKSIPAFQNFKTLKDFLMDEGRTYNASKTNNHYAQNILAFDFGFNNSTPLEEEELERRTAALIASVESNFHLILISEYFDESMVLLKHALCWDLEDIVSFRLNSRNEKSRSTLSEDTAGRVKRWNSLDWRLYLHFNATFWHRIDTLLGRDKLKEEVEALRARRAELEQTCLQGGGAVDPGQIRDSSLKPFQYGLAVIQGYNIRPGLDVETHRLCQRLITPELQYTNLLYAKQFPDLYQKYQAAAKMAAVKRLTLKHNPLPSGNGSNQNNSALVRHFIVQSKTDPVKNIQKNTNAFGPDSHKLVNPLNYNVHTLAKRDINVRSHGKAFNTTQHNIQTQTKGHNITQT